MRTTPNSGFPKGPYDANVGGDSNTTVVKDYAKTVNKEFQNDPKSSVKPSKSK